MKTIKKLLSLMTVLSMLLSLVACGNNNTTSTATNESKKYKVGIDKIRLFFYGKEMKNDLELWNYNVSQDCVVILMITKDN